MLDIFRPVIHDTNYMGHRNDNECARESRVNSTRWREKSRNQAKKIEDKYVGEEGGEDGEGAAAFFACDVYDELLHRAAENLAHVRPLGRINAYF